MKRLILIFLLLPSLSWAVEPIDLARMNVGIVGGGVAAAGCSGGTTHYVGSTTDTTSTTVINADEAYCWRFQANCTGTLGYGHIKTSDGDNGESVKIAVYADGGSDTEPTSADTALSGSTPGVVTAGVTAEIKQTAGKLGGSVTSGEYYWVCQIASASMTLYRATTGGTLYLKASFTYASPAANLDGSWSPYSSRTPILYVEIE